MTENEQLQISLLTCSPGDDVYELYGHTAIRVKDEAQDLVFNYGVFDFKTPHFAWRFMIGQTDYCLGVVSTEYFRHSYALEGRAVEEQILNLNFEEKQKLIDLLFDNWRDANWTYRYNFLYDNCTTRAVDKIEKSVDGRFVLPNVEEHSLRRLLHQFDKPSNPWYAFGIDLVLGEEVDRAVGADKQIFLPLYAAQFLDSAYVEGVNGCRRPIVAQKQWLVMGEDMVVGETLFTPLVVAVLFLILVGGLTLLEVKRKTSWPVIDYILMVVQGLLGVIVAFLYFGSEHPAVDTNWLILVLNPIPLLWLPVKIWRERRGKIDYYYPSLAIALTLTFCIYITNVQDFPTAFLVVALILLIRIIAHFMQIPSLNSPKNADRWNDRGDFILLKRNGSLNKK